MSFTSIYAILIILCEYTLCMNTLCGFQSYSIPGRIGAWIIGAACVFGSFCAILLGMEMCSIAEDSQLEAIALQLESMRSSEARSTLERHLSVLFGTNAFQFSWLIPSLPKYSEKEFQLVYGYR